MSVIEIEQNIIKPLNRSEKEELFRFLAEELGKDQIFKPGTKAAFWSPCDEYTAAQQLKDFVQEQQS